MTRPIIMTLEIWFRLVMDIMIVLSYILFTIIIVSTELEHKQSKISDTLLCWRKNNNIIYDKKLNLTRNML